MLLHSLILIGLFCFAGIPAAEAQGFGVDDRDIPPAWDIGPGQGYNNSERAVRGRKVRKKKRRVGRPWYQPRIAFGVGGNLPELVPLETWAIFGRYVGIRAYYGVPLPWRIRVEMPADIISTKRDIGVAHPDYVINFKTLYGPHYGGEIVAFPFGGSYFISAGVGRRYFRLSGDAKSPVLVCSLIQVAMEPPCGDEDATLRTETELEIEAHAVTVADVVRGTTGWMWHLGSVGYMTLTLGVAKPYRSNVDVTVITKVDAPGDDDRINGALSDLRIEKESELAGKARDEVKPVVEQISPVLGLGFGFRL